MNMIFTQDTMFMTGSFRRVYLSEIVGRIEDFLFDAEDYSIDIGTDSQKGSRTKFVTAIAVHKVGKGGIFFYHPIVDETRQSMQARIYTETAMSINCATELLELFVERGVLWNISIHCDVGQNGKTREMIREIIGYVTSSGFDCKIKPEAVAACTIADRFSK